MILTYGNGTYYSRQTEAELQKKHQIDCQILDFRWLSPVNWDRVVKETKRFQKVLIVEGCRKTGSFSEEKDLWRNQVMPKARKPLTTTTAAK